jgi:ankyrin repeat protein
MCPLSIHGKGCPCRQLTTNASIFTAAELGDHQRVNYLLATGRTKFPNVRDAYGYTALHYAAQHDRVEVVKCLLERGANADGVLSDSATVRAPLNKRITRYTNRSTMQVHLRAFIDATRD